MSQASCPAAPPQVCAPAAGHPVAQDRGPPTWRIVAWFPAALHNLAGPWRREAAIRELRRLKSAELRDIGIERGEVENIVDALMGGRPQP